MAYVKAKQVTEVAEYTIDWLSRIRFNTIVENEYSTISELQWRKLLYQFSWNYYEHYHTDWLDEAFLFIEEELKNKNARVILKDELESINKEMPSIIGEYGFSLPAIAKAVSMLLEEVAFDKARIRKFINLVCEAFSYSENDSFLTKEDEYLHELFGKIKDTPGVC